VKCLLNVRWLCWDRGKVWFSSVLCSSFNNCSDCGFPFCSFRVYSSPVLY